MQIDFLSFLSVFALQWSPTIEFEPKIMNIRLEIDATFCVLYHVFVWGQRRNDNQSLRQLLVAKSSTNFHRMITNLLFLKLCMSLFLHLWICSTVSELSFSREGFDCFISNYKSQEVKNDRTWFRLFNRSLLSIQWRILRKYFLVTMVNFSGVLFLTILISCFCWLKQGWLIFDLFRYLERVGVSYPCTHLHPHPNSHVRTHPYPHTHENLLVVDIREKILLAVVIEEETIVFDAVHRLATLGAPLWPTSFALNR